MRAGPIIILKLIHGLFVQNLASQEFDTRISILICIFQAHFQLVRLSNPLRASILRFISSRHYKILNFDQHLHLLFSLYIYTF